MLDLFFTGLIIFAAAKLLEAYIDGRTSARDAPTHSPKSLLSDWERHTLPALRRALPAGWNVCPQVHVADIVTIDGGTNRTRFATLNKLRARSVDFVLIDAAGTPRLVIELDDASHFQPHRRRRDAENDAVFAQAGIPVRHISPGRAPDWPAIIEATTGAPSARELAPPPRTASPCPAPPAPLSTAPPPPTGRAPFQQPASPRSSAAPPRLPTSNR